MSAPRSQHVPVMPEEVLHWLVPRPGQVLVDGTLGGGGHTRLLAQRVGNEGRVIALDRDPAAIALAERSLYGLGDSLPVESPCLYKNSLAGLPVTLVESNFRDLPQVLRQLSIGAVDGVLLDLGLSSDQLADPSRGFSFAAEGPLDLRFDPSQGEPAARLVNKLREKNLADLIFRYGEERHSRRIAKAIVAARRRRPIETAAELAEIIRRAVPGSRHSRGEKIDPATRTFQALRIAVNDELDTLAQALRHLPDCLSRGGRIVVISFHSLEDRIVKQAFRDDDRLEVLTRRPVRPGEEETARNPRARSAKLRAAEQRTR